MTSLFFFLMTPSFFLQNSLERIYYEYEASEKHVCTCYICVQVLLFFLHRICMR